MNHKPKEEPENPFTRVVDLTTALNGYELETRGKSYYEQLEASDQEVMVASLQRDLVEIPLIRSQLSLAIRDLEAVEETYKELHGNAVDQAIGNGYVAIHDSGSAFTYIHMRLPKATDIDLMEEIKKRTEQ